MSNLIPLFRTDPIAKWKEVYKDAEGYYEQLLKKVRKNLSHIVYLCSPLKPTAEKLVQVHIAEAISAASQILGAEYNRRKIAVWIPHFHLFSIYNEIVYPETRAKAISFNNHLMQQYFDTLIVNGNRISGGMAAEMELAKKNGIEVMKLGIFRKRLRNLPDSEKAKESYRKMVGLHNKIHGSKFLIEQ